jgi:isocitrate lyase
VSADFFMGEIQFDMYTSASFVLQLISLAGLHSNAAATGMLCSCSFQKSKQNDDIGIAELAARYEQDGMLAYVELVQRKEREIGCDVLTHQKW